MKKRYANLSISELSGWFGYSRQNYYSRVKQIDRNAFFEQEILGVVHSLRCDQPKLGTVKLHYLINQQLTDQSIGRDALYNLLRKNGLLIRKRKVYRPKMTDGNGKSIYPDRRKGFIPDGINQLWCSDITWIELETQARHCYLICITDEYSHLIVGYCLEIHMKTEQLLKALDIAVSSQLEKGSNAFKEPVIMHSDRGSQYKSAKFLEALERYNMLPSMCAAGCSHENPVAERLNGILKNELLSLSSFESFKQAKQAVEKAIKIYNEQRPHLSCGLLTPKQAHQGKGVVLKKLWRQRKTKRRRVLEA